MDKSSQVKKSKFGRLYSTQLHKSNWNIKHILKNYIPNKINIQRKQENEHRIQDDGNLDWQENGGGEMEWRKTMYRLNS